MGLFRKGSTGSGIKFDVENDWIQVYDIFKSVWRNWKQTGLIVKPATITITTTTLTGQPVTCQVGSESYTTTFVDGKAIFIVFTEGTATISCNDSRVTVQTVLGQSVSAELDEVLAITLYENGEVQNGAVKNDNYSVSYDVAFELLRGRVLKFDLNNTYTATATIYFYFTGASGTHTIKGKSDGTVGNVSAETLSVGEYSFQFEDMYNANNSISDTTNFRVKIVDTDGYSYPLTYFNKIWIE